MFWLKHEGQLAVVPRTKITRAEELIALAPDVFWRNMAQQDKLTTDVCRSIGDSITRVAGDLGQVDRSRTPSGAAPCGLPDGKVAYHLGRPRADRRHGTWPE